MSRKEIEKQQKRLAILNSAKNLFIKNGYQKTTIAQIAEAASIAKGLIYQYYKGKEEILAQLAANSFNEFLRLLKSNLQITPGKNIEGQLTIIAETIIAYQVGNNSKYFSYITELPNSSLIELENLLTEFLKPKQNLLQKLIGGSDNLKVELIRDRILTDLSQQSENLAKKYQLLAKIWS